MKIPIIIIILYSFYLSAWHMSGAIKNQDYVLLEIQAQKQRFPEGTMAARKANVPFMLNLKFKVMPDDVEAQDFIVWCKQNEIDYICWSQVEWQLRPNLRSKTNPYLPGEWIKEIQPLWHKEGWGFIGKIRS